MTKQSSLVSRLRTLSILVAILCGLFVVATFGMQLPSRPWSPVNIDKPTTADSNEKITAIVDSESRRVLILDEQRMLVGMVQCGVLNSPLDTITDICVSNDTIYVAGAMYKKDSNIIARERVVAYDMFGSSEEVVFDTETKNALLPEIKTMDDAEDGTEIANNA